MGREKLSILAVICITVKLGNLIRCPVRPDCHTAFFGAEGRSVTWDVLTHKKEKSGPMSRFTKRQGGDSGKAMQEDELVAVAKGLVVEKSKGLEEG
jgi:hypothetical protein